MIRDPADGVAAFGIGFGLSQPLFSFVDVGYGKERADHKVTEMMRAMIRLNQCRHLYFGPCNDNGYLNLLEEYKRDDAVARRLTLIETQPAQRGFVGLGLPRISFPAVFRSEPLPDNVSRKDSSGGGAYASAAQVAQPLSAVNANSREKRVTFRPGPPQDALATTPAGKTDSSRGRYILLNEDSDRLDEELPAAEPWAIESYATKTKQQGRNFCNFHHLHG